MCRTVKLHWTLKCITVCIKKIRSPASAGPASPSRFMLFLMQPDCEQYLLMYGIWRVQSCHCQWLTWWEDQCKSLPCQAIIHPNWSCLKLPVGIDYMCRPRKHRKHCAITIKLAKEADCFSPFSARYCSFFSFHIHCAKKALHLINRGHLVTLPSL